MTRPPLAARVAALEAARVPMPVHSTGARDELMRRLDTLGRRMREDPAWREPTLEESAADLAALQAYFAERFGRGAGS